MSIDVEALRRATPATATVAHLNNAGAALPSRATLNATIAHLQLEAAIGGYEAASAAQEALTLTRTSIAQLLNATPAEIALTTSDSQSFLKAFWALVHSGWFSPGDVVAVDRLSYNSHHLALLQAVSSHGIRVEVVNSRIDIDAAARLVAYTHVGTHSGAVNDLSGVAAITRARGVPFFVDACQSVGQLEVDVGSIGCDVLTGTGRKWLRAPRGTGFLYVSDAWIERLEPLGIDGHSASWTAVNSYEVNADATRFEEFECCVAARIGMGVAVQELLTLGVASVAERVAVVAGRLRSGLAAMDRVAVHDGDGAVCGIVTFTVDGVAPDAVAAAAQRAAININTSTAAWARVDMDGSKPQQKIRASPHAYNTEAEVDRLLEVVASSANPLQNS